jgi:hypothetical protein
MTPWFRLPALQAALYGGAPGKGAGVAASAQLLPFAQLAGTWWRNRLRRVLEEDYRDGAVAAAVVDRAARFVGSRGVSFLTV